MNNLLSVMVFVLVSFNPPTFPFTYGMPNSPVQAEQLQNWFKIKYGDCVFDSKNVDTSLQHTLVIEQVWKCSKNHMQCVENWIEVDYGKGRGKRLGHTVVCDSIGKITPTYGGERNWNRGSGAP